jgi:hypothetical protein
MAALIAAAKERDQIGALIAAMRVENSAGTTPLHALAWNRSDGMKALIDAAKDDDGTWNALMAAMQVEDNEGNTPLSELKKRFFDKNRLAKNRNQSLLDFLDNNKGNPKIAELRTKLGLK